MYSQIPRGDMIDISYSSAFIETPIKQILILSLYVSFKPFNISFSTSSDKSARSMNSPIFVIACIDTTSRSVIISGSDDLVQPVIRF